MLIAPDDCEPVLAAFEIETDRLDCNKLPPVIAGCGKGPSCVSVLARAVPCAT